VWLSNKRNCLAYRFYSCIPSLPFLWRKYCVEYSTWFCLSKTPQLFLKNRFSQTLRGVESFIGKGKPCLVCERLSLQSWHNRLTLYLTLASAKKRFSKVSFLHLSFKRELSVSPNCGNLDVVWLSLRVRRVTYVLQVVTVSVTL